MSPHAPGSESCREVFARLSEYLDAELDSGLCDRIEAHLDDCPPCLAFLESLRRTVGAVGSLPRPSLPREVRVRVVDEVRRMAERLAGEGGED